jgi:hypothetical protein
MIKTIFGNTILNNTCSKILHSNYTFFKQTLVLFMLVMSMIIILFEIILKKINPGNWNIKFPLKKQNPSLKPINKLA